MRIAIQQPALPAYRVPLFRQMCEAMPEHELTVYYGSEEPELKNAEPVGFKGVLSRFTCFRLPIIGELRWHGVQWQLVDGKRADIVVLSSNIRVISFWFALLRARMNKVPVMIWGHGYSKTNSGVVANWMRSLPVKLSSAVMFYDSKTAAEFHKSIGVDENSASTKLFAANNGLDTTFIQSERQRALVRFPSSEDAKQHLNLGDGAVLIYVGRLMPANRLDLAVMALPSILKQHPKSKLVVIGGGDEYKKQLCELAKSANLTGQIVWVGPMYSEQDLAPWLLAADLFVYPCNVGLSLIHAFNYALPAVICAPLSEHNPEVAAAKDGVNTVVAGDQTSEALSAAILTLLDNPEEADLMGQSSLRCVLDTHNIEKMVESFCNAFASLKQA